jgi:hypothetical protein
VVREGKGRLEGLWECGELSRWAEHCCVGLCCSVLFGVGMDRRVGAFGNMYCGIKKEILTGEGGEFIGVLCICCEYVCFYFIQRKWLLVE